MASGKTDFKNLSDKVDKIWDFRQIKTDHYVFSKKREQIQATLPIQQKPNNDANPNKFYRFSVKQQTVLIIKSLI